MTRNTKKKNIQLSPRNWNLELGWSFFAAWIVLSFGEVKLVFNTRRLKLSTIKITSRYMRFADARGDGVRLWRNFLAYYKRTFFFHTFFHFTCSRFLRTDFFVFFALFCFSFEWLIVYSLFHITITSCKLWKNWTGNKRFFARSDSRFIYTFCGRSSLSVIKWNSFHHRIHEIRKNWIFTIECRFE